MIGSFKCKFHFHNKGMTYRFHDIALVHDDFIFLVLDDELFINEFYGIELAIFLKPTQIYFRKPTRANALKYLKAVDINFWTNKSLYC